MKTVLLFAANCLALCTFVLATPGHAQPPSNDDFDSATIVVEPLPFNDSVNTSEATTASDDPDCFGNGPTVWYSYTPSTGGAVQADTFGSDYDTTLSVYTGSRGSLTEIECNDDAGDTTQSRVEWDADAGTTYYLMAGAYGGGPGGTLNFTVDEAPPPAFQEIIVESTQVVPKVGRASASITAVFGRSVYVEFIDSYVWQRSGRGAVFSNSGKFIGEETDAASTNLLYDPWFDAKGFIGGPAQVCAYVYFYDPLVGASQVDGGCFDIRLKGSRAE